MSIERNRGIVINSSLEQKSLSLSLPVSRAPLVNFRSFDVLRGDLRSS